MVGWERRVPHAARTVIHDGPEVRPPPRQVRPEALTKTGREPQGRRHAPMAAKHKNSG